MSDQSTQRPAIVEPRPPATVIIVRPTRLRIPLRIPAVLFAIPIGLAALIYWRAMTVGPGALQTRWLNGMPKVVSMLYLSGGMIVVLSQYVASKLNKAPYTSPVPDRFIPPGAPAALAISALWRSPFRSPRIARVRAALDAESIPLKKSAVFVALGTWKPPEIEDVPFEPEVVSPGDRFHKARPILVRVALVFAFLMLAPLVIPGLGRSVRGITLQLALAFVVLIYFVWATVIRMRYLRLAPGMLQVLPYRPFSKSPRIRSYPIKAGTLILLHKGWTSHLVLARDSQVDRIGLNGLMDRNSIIEKVWRAVLSTAPTPPLDSENLVG